MSLLTIAQAEPTVHQSSHDSIQPTRWGDGEEEKKEKKEKKVWRGGGEREETEGKTDSPGHKRAVDKGKVCGALHRCQVALAGGGMDAAAG
jgi:hypothetical protein